MGEDLSVRGSSSSEYWVYREDYYEHFETRTEIDVSYKGFMGKLGYFLWEPSEYGAAIRQRILSFGYVRPPVEILLGQYYATFGRGLVLRQYLDKDFKHDKSLTGVKLTADLSAVGITLLSGRPRNLLLRAKSTLLENTAETRERFVYEFVNDTLDVLRGIDLRLSPTRRVLIGGNYLRFTQESDVTPCAFTELIGGNLSYSVGDWDSYVEYAQQLECSASRGRVTGEGVYVSLSGGLAGLGLTAQYANYQDLGAGESDYRYNDPPTPLRSGLSINRGIDERGGSAMISASLGTPLYFEAEYGFLETLDRTQAAGEWYTHLTYDISGGLSASLGATRTNEKEIEPGIKELELRPSTELTYYLPSGDAIEVQLSAGIIEEDQWEENSRTWSELDYTEKSFLVSYSHSSLLSVSLFAEHRSRKVERLSPKTFWVSAEITADLQPNLSARLVVGSTKGGLVCKGGVCRLEPDFEGLKAGLSYIF